MSFYQDKNKIIYHRYRMIIKIIWSFRYINSVSFRANILLLINLIYSYTFMVYGEHGCLVDLNDYYSEMCIDEMYKRLKLEFDKRGF